VQASLTVVADRALARRDRDTTVRFLGRNPDQPRFLFAKSQFTFFQNSSMYLGRAFR